jgi:hypothetical protein
MPKKLGKFCSKIKKKIPESQGEAQFERINLIAYADSITDFRAAFPLGSSPEP